MSHDLHSDLNNPNLFEENQPGKYEYGETAYGKTASGALTIADDPTRDSKAQQAAGGDDRRSKDNELGPDDGGHIIGARFGGAPGAENMTAQNSNLNRSSYKRAENNWADHLKAEDKVFVHIETDDRGERPDYYTGYVIYEHPDGTRDWETIGFNNESTRTQDEWDKELEDAYSKDPTLTADMSSSDTGGLSAEEWEKAMVEAEEAEYSKGGNTYSSYLGSAGTSQSLSSIDASEQSADYLGTASVESGSRGNSAEQGVSKSVSLSSAQSNDYLGTAAVDSNSQESSVEQGNEQSSDESAGQSADDSLDMD